MQAVKSDLGLMREMAEMIRQAADDLRELERRALQAEADHKDCYVNLLDAEKRCLDESERRLQAEADLKEMQAQRDGAREALLMVAQIANDIAEGRPMPEEPHLQHVRLKVASPGKNQPCPNCFGKGLEGQDDRPGILIPFGGVADECRVCGGSGVASPGKNQP